MRISASAIIDYLTCPQKYYFRSVAKEDAEVTQDLIVGKLFHSMAEKGWQEGREPLRELVKDNPEYSMLESKKIDKLNKCLNTFDSGLFDGHYFLFSDNDLVEHWFSLPLGSDTLVGKIDRITSDGYLIDWKTSSTAPTEYTIRRDIQFIIYDYAYEQLFGKRAKLFCINVNVNKVIEYKRDNMVFDYFMNSGIYKILDEIKKSDFPLWGIFNGSCYMCQFKSICIGGKK